MNRIAPPNNIDESESVSIQGLRGRGDGVLTCREHVWTSMSRCGNPGRYEGLT